MKAGRCTSTGATLNLSQNHCV